MGAQPNSQYIRRAAGNVILGLGVFALLLLGLVVGLGLTGEQSDAVLDLAEATEYFMLPGPLPSLWPARYVDNMGTMAGLVLAFALLCAFNLGFWGHVRRVCASPRRWRGRR